jgi:pyruvate carboxylase
MDIFRIFDSLNYLPNMKVRHGSCSRTWKICLRGCCLLHW